MKWLHRLLLLLGSALFLWLVSQVGLATVWEEASKLGWGIVFDDPEKGFMGAPPSDHVINGPPQGQIRFDIPSISGGVKYVGSNPDAWELYLHIVVLGLPGEQHVYTVGPF